MLVVLLACIAAAVGAVIFLLQWHANVQAADRYHAGRACFSGSSVDCLRYVRVSIVDTYTERSGYGSRGSQYTYYVTVRLPNGRMQDEAASGHAQLFDALSPGMAVLAEYWNGKMVSLVASDGSRLGLRNQPDWQAGEMLAGAWLMFSLILVLVTIALAATHPKWTGKSWRSAAAVTVGGIAWLASGVFVVLYGNGAGSSGPSGKAHLTRPVAISLNHPTARKPTPTPAAARHVQGFYSDPATGVAATVERHEVRRGSGYDVPSGGHVWFWLYVSLHNGASTARQYNALDFQARDQANRRYAEGIFEMSGRHHELSYGTLSAGRSRAGWIGFVIPSATTSLTLLWDDGSALLGSPAKLGTYALPH